MRFLHLFILLYVLNLYVFAQEENSQFLQMVEKYNDYIVNDTNGRIYKVTSYDGSYDIFEYGDVSGKIERIFSYNSAGELLEITVFFRDSVTGQLLGYTKGQGFGFFSSLGTDNDVFLKGNSEKYNVYNMFFSSLVITTDNKALDFTYDNDGNLIINNDNGSVSIYDKMGKILSNDKITYFYDDANSLVMTQQTDDDGFVVNKKFYENSSLVNEEFYENNILSKKIIYKLTGNVEERYESGKLYARITYFEDNKKVKDIEYI